LPAPQEAPSAWLPLSTQVDTPLAHDVVPTLHAVDTWHDFPAAHAVQVPELHTLSVPHEVPLGMAAPVSMQAMAGEHAVLPA